jgi:hypothetical protein
VSFEVISDGDEVAILNEIVLLKIWNQTPKIAVYTPKANNLGMMHSCFNVREIPFTPIYDEEVLINVAL